VTFTRATGKDRRAKLAAAMGIFGDKSEGVTVFEAPRHPQVPAPTTHDLLVSEWMLCFDTLISRGPLRADHANVLVTLAGVALLPHHEQFNPRFVFPAQKRLRGGIGPYRISPRYNKIEDFPGPDDPQMLGPIEVSAALPDALVLAYVDIVRVVWFGAGLIVDVDTGTSTTQHELTWPGDLGFKIALARYEYEKAALLWQLAVEDERAAGAVAQVRSLYPALVDRSTPPTLHDGARSLLDPAMIDPEFLLAYIERCSPVVEDFRTNRAIPDDDPLVCLL
jgi:hypothetical protein